MKKVFFNSLIILLLAPAISIFGQKDVFVSKAVLKTAEWANFSYKDVLKKAIAGDGASITQFFKFNSAVDGVEAVEHNVTCLELIPLASDTKVANALLFATPKLKKIVVDRMILAQGKTQKQNLKKPIESWAPKTWAVLNNLPLPADPANEKEMAEKMKNMDKDPNTDAGNDGRTMPTLLSPDSRGSGGQLQPGTKKQ